MKLVRYGKPGKEKPGMLDAEGKLRDLSGVIGDISPATIPGLSKLKKLKPETLPAVKGSQRLGPCVGNITNFFCIGLNYADHAAETGSALPEKPIVFIKANGAITGPFDDIPVPKGSKTCDWEVELGVIIGKKTKYVSVKDAMDSVAGYCVVNDVSERALQGYLRPQTHWALGKSPDGFGPVGPWFVTKDEVKDPLKLKLWCSVNGKMRQNGTTSTMIFNVAQVISFISQSMTLHPGDIIATGTPPGVAMGMKPKPIFLKAGDVMKTGIEGLGEQVSKMVADK